MSGLESLLDRLSTEERLRGPGFEQLTKWVLESAPEYAARLTRKWLWAEWPGRGGRRDRLLIATTDHLGQTTRRTLEGQAKPVGHCGVPIWQPSACRGPDCRRNFIRANGNR